MKQLIKILRIDQKIRIITYFSLIGFSSLIFGVLFDFFKGGFICSLLCWIITGVIESSYSHEELGNPVLYFSPLNFLIIGLTGVGILSIMIVLLFLLA